MPDYRIGSFTLPGETLDADPIVVYFAKLPGGGDISGDLEKVIAAIEYALQRLDMEAYAAILAQWLEHFAATANLYDTTRIELSDTNFVYAQISNGFLDEEPLIFDTEEEFIEALGLPRSSYYGG
ncbi:hypothetical protein [Rhizobium phaseoli]|uniref:hypothetical protein n=1 Tax=Rhizobium phaseoli TaxID=396 RepID=UPI000BE8B70B|nr:hypothetical protein [Rhizobium phaseoli]PDS28004.1 hypothetical protein CO650_28595 [Rhizobium phaseoli]